MSEKIKISQIRLKAFLLCKLVFIGALSYSQTRIKVKLNPVSINYSKIQLNDYMQTESDVSSFKVPEFFKNSFHIKKYIVDYEGYFKSRYASGLISQKTYDSLLFAYQLEGRNVNYSDFGAIMYLLVYKISDSTYSIIPDLNFNKDFTDDTSYQCLIGAPTPLIPNSCHKAVFKAKLENNFAFRILKDTGGNGGDEISVVITYYNTLSGSFQYQDKLFKLEFFPQFYSAYPRGGDYLFSIRADETQSNLEIKKLEDVFKIKNQVYKLASFNVKLLEAEVITESRL